MKLPLIISGVIAIAFTVFFSHHNQVLAQSSPIGTASYVAISDKNVQDGSIISSNNGQFTLSNKIYDQLVVGVVALKPAILLDVDKVPAGMYPVVTNGQAMTLVSGRNGAIKKGDPIATSPEKGIGMKALQSGYVLGYALEDFTPTKPTDIKKIAINIKIYLYTTQPTFISGLLDVLKFSAVAAAEQPLLVFRYALAAIVLLIAAVLAFLSFGRLASRGVEALGRNPLAGRMIQLGVALNTIIAVAIIGAAIVVAFLIIKL